MFETSTSTKKVKKGKKKTKIQKVDTKKLKSLAPFTVIFFPNFSRVEGNQKFTYKV